MKCTITSYELRAINYRCFGRLTLQIVIIKVFSFYSRQCTWYFWLALAYVQTLFGWLLDRQLVHSFWQLCTGRRHYHLHHHSPSSQSVFLVFVLDFQCCCYSACNVCDVAVGVTQFMVCSKLKFSSKNGIKGNITDDQNKLNLRIINFIL